MIFLSSILGDGTCWIKENPNKNETNYFQLTFFIPLLIYFIFSILALIYIYVRTRGIVVKEEKKLTQKIRMRTQIFVLVFIFCWLGPVTYRITQFFNIQNKAFTYWAAIAVSGQGFANALVWLTHPRIFKGKISEIWID